MPKDRSKRGVIKAEKERSSQAEISDRERRSGEWWDPAESCESHWWGVTPGD